MLDNESRSPKKENGYTLGTEGLDMILEERNIYGMMF
jgi:hypothetical protein